MKWSSVKGIGIFAATGTIALSMAFAGLPGCSGRQAARADGPRAYPYEIVTSVGMVADIVRQVAGDRAKITELIGSGVDPHLYKPTRGDVIALQRGDFVFYSGLMLEGKMSDTLEKIGRTKPVVAVTEKIERSYLLTPPDFEGHPDPHVWMDPAAWIKCVEAVADALSRWDPANAAYYKANAEPYIARLTELKAYGQRVIATIPEQSRVLITSHDAFNYFGRAFNLQVMGVQGLSTESEAGLQDINRLVDRIVARDIRAVFIESSVPAKNIQALVDGARARGGKVSIGGELFSDAMGEAGTYEGTYIGMIDHNITTVTRALGGQAPVRGMQEKLTVGAYDARE